MDALRFFGSAARLGSALAVIMAAVSLPAAPAAKPIDKPAAAVEVRGLLIPFEQANLSSRSTGVIRTIKNEGDAVHKDEVVVNLEDDAERLSVEGERAVMEKRAFEASSSRKLHETGTKSEDDLRTAETNLKTSKLQVDQAVVMQDKKVVRSPLDGVVVRRIRSVGEAVDQYMPLLNVVDLSKVYLEAFLPAAELKEVQVGQPVEVRLPDLPGRTFTGQVNFIAPVIDPASGEFRIKILLANDERALRPGMSATGLLGVPSAQQEASRK